MHNIADLFTYCINDSYVHEGIGLMALLITATVLIGSVVLYVVARVARLQISYQQSLLASVLVGNISLLMGMIYATADFCGADEDVLFGLTVLAIAAGAMAVLHCLLRASIARTAVVALSSAAISYLVVVYLLFSVVL
jgi:hypothetical protein